MKFDPIIITVSDHRTENGGKIIKTFLKRHQDCNDLVYDEKSGVPMYAVYKTPWALANEDAVAVLSSIYEKPNEKQDAQPQSRHFRH